ncbi:MAG TPA: hypothetical protein VM074_10125 [Solimonas sp.]|nr:hypothetical protein [Solimonas sp.]
MSRITISVRGADPNPALVMALRRVTGLGVAEIAEALSQGTPLFDEDLFEAHAEGQLQRLHQVLTYLRITSLQLFITEDGRPLSESRLTDAVNAWELVLARAHAPAPPNPVA